MLFSLLLKNPMTLEILADFSTGIIIRYSVRDRGRERKSTTEIPEVIVHIWRPFSSVFVLPPVSRSPYRGLHHNDIIL